MQLVAIVPARGGSKGLPGKNRMYLQDKHLLGWPIEAALKSKYVDAVYLTTEDKVLAEFGRHYGAEIIDRPVELASDTATSEEVIQHALTVIPPAKYLVYLQPTSPLTDEKDIDGAFELLKRNKRKADAVVGVGKMLSNHPLYNVRIDRNGLIKPVSTDSFKVMRRQDIEDIYFLNGSLFMSDVKVFKKLGTFYHERTLPWVNPKYKSIDIDDITDFVCVEAIAENMKRREKEGSHAALC